MNRFLTKHSFAVSCVLLILAILLFFAYFNGVGLPLDAANNAGTHTWLSGSTIKFTNNWLQNGPGSESFYMAEYPSSIETPDLESRSIYIAYPSGTVFLTYLAARLSGSGAIGFGFIQKLSVCLYAFCACILGIFFLTVFTKLLNSKRLAASTIAAFILACVWIVLPANSYYLRYVLFADQMVLCFIYALILLSVMDIFHLVEKPKAVLLVRAALFFVILAGVSIDYYFWIQVFIIALVHFILLLRRKCGWRQVLAKMLLYVVPVLLSVGVFVAQILSSGTLDKLAYKLLYRAGMHTDSGSFLDNLNSIRGFIISAYGMFAPLFFGIILLLVLCLPLLYRARKRNREIHAVFILGILVTVPAFIQLLLLSNHSAIHEFSIVKLGFILVFGLFLCAFAAQKCMKQPHKLQLAQIVVAVCIVFCCSGNIADQAAEYHDERRAYDDYSLAYTVGEYARYSHVLFSFTEQIPTNPPQQLAISAKAVYKVSTTREIDSFMQQLPPDASAIVILRRDDADKSPEILAQEETVRQEYPLWIETDLYELYAAQ